ncbi:MAG TPA: hypothetical protein DCY03_25430 [Planctomycetaceae bacterium]|nr:hypothetical protein [Planctomycetaceae bacterium]
MVREPSPYPISDQPATCPVSRARLREARTFGIRQATL